MGRLIKYEFRKNSFSKLIFLGITVVMEILFLIGLYGHFERPMIIGMLGLFFSALAGITYIGIESILTLYRDLTTKQSYMLFMTPNSSYRILGAKAIENAGSVLLAGIFFGALATLDFTLLFKEAGEAANIFDMFRDMLRNIDPRLDLSLKPLLTLLFMILCSWILRIATGYLAVVLTCTLLSGRKGAAIISFVFFIAISLLISWGMNLLPKDMDIILKLNLTAVISLICSIVMYFITAWIMDRKLSV